MNDGGCREMTLHEYCAQVPESHLVNRELRELEQQLAAANAAREAAERDRDEAQSLGREFRAAYRAAEARLAAAAKAWGPNEAACVDVDGMDAALADASPPLAVVEGHVVMLKQPRIVGRLPVDFQASPGDSFPIVVLPKPKEGT